MRSKNKWTRWGVSKNIMNVGGCKAPYIFEYQLNIMLIMRYFIWDVLKAIWVLVFIGERCDKRILGFTRS